MQVTQGNALDGVLSETAGSDRSKGKITKNCNLT